MPDIDTNTIKLAKMLEIDSGKAMQLYDVVGLGELAALTTAINNNDIKTVKAIYSKYQQQINTNVDPNAVKDHYNQLINDEQQTPDEALINTADFFGITGEHVTSIIEPETTKESTPYIADPAVKNAYNNMHEMLEGKASRNVITELNAWQRRMFFGLVPTTVSKIMQKTLDMTPIAIMQKHAELMGYGEPAIRESELSLNSMLEKILESELANFNQTVIEDQLNDEDDQEVENQELDQIDEKTRALIKSIVDRKF